MDRSFLSHANVIEASRSFVCVRLATYEDPIEAKFLKNFTSTRSGELENSVFGILAPDGKQKLVRSGRSPSHVFNGPDDMAERMQAIASKYPADPKTPVTTLPLVAHVKLGVNVAAADHQPLVAIIADTAEERQRLEANVAKLAWQKEFIGCFIYASGAVKDATMVEGPKPTSGVVVVLPEQFGRSGKVVGSWSSSQTTDELAKVLRSSLRYVQKPTNTFAGHVRDGQRQGVFWEPPVPVSDPMEQQARERGKKLNPPKK